MGLPLRVRTGTDRAANLAATAHLATLGISGCDGFYRMNSVRHSHTKTDIDVAIVGIVPVAIRTAGIVRFIIERSAPQHAPYLPTWPTRATFAALAL